MTQSGKRKKPEKQDQFIADLRRGRQAREAGYRDRALRMLPHVCASCGREFSGKRLRELTVHHKNHDHNHNPADGSNWELLCVYCHDHEHEKFHMKGRHPATPGAAAASEQSIFSPFENLDILLKNESPDKE